MVVEMDLSESGLYQHFLDHTAKAAFRSDSDNTALGTGMAALAIHNDAVRHSILAVSESCMCCDRIREGTTDSRNIRQALSIGLQRHTLALEGMQVMVAHPNAINMEPMLANAALLIPFAFAFLHISQWLAKHDPEERSKMQRTSTSPREAMTLLRGLRSTQIALHKTKSEMSYYTSPGQSPQSIGTPPAFVFPFLPQWHEHPLLPVLSRTSEHAFSELGKRVSNASVLDMDDDTSMTACQVAFDQLKAKQKEIFLFPDQMDLSAATEYATDYHPEPESLLAQIPDWLRAYTSRVATRKTSEPLVRLLFGFFFRAPQDFLNVLWPLLEDEEDEIMSHADLSISLSSSQILALDIYAHWLVLLLLGEGESWWLGNFPTLALRRLVERYGTDLEAAAQSKQGHQWWPASMLGVATQLTNWS